MARSNRIYPKKLCINPECKKSFIPHDRRQNYCSAQCRNNFFNDRRHEENQTKYKDEGVLREMDKKLGKIYEKNVMINQTYVSLEVLKYEGIDPNLCVRTVQNDLTKQAIRWYYSYGLEIKDTERKTFLIHKRSKF